MTPPALPARARHVATCETAIEAQRLVDVLDDAGVRAFVEDAHTNTWFWQWGRALGGCRVLVGAQDEERARAVLADHEGRAAPRAGLASSDAAASEDAEPDDDEDAGEAQADARADAEAWAASALRWAILGVLLLPVLGVLLLALPFRLANPPPGVEGSPLARRRVRAARAIVWTALLAVLGLVLFLALR